MKTITDLVTKVWAMELRALEGLMGQLADLDITDFAAATVAAADRGLRYQLRGNGTAVIPISGVILKEVPWIFEMFGITAASTKQIQAAMDRALGDDAVKEVLFAVDSPGGTIDGVQELGDSMYAAGREKPTRAFISDMGASAAYWLASQTQGIYANQSAMVGSIGVYAVIEDVSKMAEEIGVKVHVISSGKYKGDTVAGVSVAEDTLKDVQRIIDDLAEIFIGAVARGREAKASAIADIADGRMWVAEDAEALGLIDGVANYAKVIGEVKKPKGGVRRKRAAAALGLLKLE